MSGELAADASNASRKNAKPRSTFALSTQVTRRRPIGGRAVALRARCSNARRATRSTPLRVITIVSSVDVGR